MIVPSWISSRRGTELNLEGEPSGAPRLDIRAAPWYEWTLLEGIGEARARRIVEHRERKGGFRSLDDLREVPGLPRDWLERVRPYLHCGPAAGSGGPPRPHRRPSGEVPAEPEDGN